MARVSRAIARSNIQGSLLLIQRGWKPVADSILANFQKLCAQLQPLLPILNPPLPIDLIPGVLAAG